MHSSYFILALPCLKQRLVFYFIFCKPFYCIFSTTIYPTYTIQYFKSNYSHEIEHANESTIDSLTASHWVFITLIRTALPRAMDWSLGNALATSEFIRQAKLSGRGLCTGIDPELIQTNITSLDQKSPFKYNL